MNKELLINCVRAERAIWDKSHPHHHNVLILRKHWKNIARKVGKPDKDVKAMWKNLRQEFGKQWRKCTRSGDAAPDEEVVSSWPFYAAMDFLTDQFKPRKMTGNMQSHQNDSQNPIPDEDDVEESLMTPLFTTQDPEMFPPPSPGMSDSSSGPRPQPHQSQSSTSASLFRQRKTQQTVIEEALLSIEKQKLELRRLNFTEPDDDNILFLKSLAPQMRKLGPQQNMLFRTEMQRRLYELLYPPHQPNYLLQPLHTTAPTAQTQNAFPEVEVPQIFKQENPAPVTLSLHD